MIRKLINTIDELHKMVDSLNDERELVAACCSRCSQCTQRSCPIKRHVLKNGGAKHEASATIIEFKPKFKNKTL